MSSVQISRFEVAEQRLPTYVSIEITASGNRTVCLKVKHALSFGFGLDL